MNKVVIGLTGGIGTGKSTVTSFLREKNYHVVDADELAKKTLMVGEVGYQKVVEIFGREILLTSGEINRKKLGQIVFNNKESLLALEEITTQVVINNIHQLVSCFKTSSSDSILFIDAPLLIEKNLNVLCDYVWVVTAPKEIIKDRIKKRDNISESDIESLQNNQLPEYEKLKFATHIINNNSTFSHLYGEINDALYTLM